MACRPRRFPSSPRILSRKPRTLDTSDDGIERMPPSYPKWSNFDVPYLRGLYKNYPLGSSSKSGWRGRYMHDAVMERCSLGGAAPDVPRAIGSRHMDTTRYRLM